jgi:hypothetical protein
VTIRRFKVNKKRGEMSVGVKLGREEEKNSKRKTKTKSKRE